MRINTNISAIVSNNALQKAQNALSTSIERLSSGYKLNSSLDDPAGCAISEKMRIQIRGLNQANNNASDGVSVLNTAEGAMAEIQSMLTRLKELTVQAANDVNSDSERRSIQEEINNINSEIDRISDQTEFNTQSLINGNLTRRVYSDYQGVNQLECSDNFVAGIYGITVTSDARQAVAVASSVITMTDTQEIGEGQTGNISINGYNVEIEKGDTLDTIMGKLVEGMNYAGGNAFTVVDPYANDTKTNGTKYAGYEPATVYNSTNLVFMTNQYGSDQKLNINCDNQELANLLGIPEAYSNSIIAEGRDVTAEFSETTVSGVTSRVGFDNSAVLSTKGTVITITDVNNKEFVLDVPGNVSGTVFNDKTRTNGKSGVLNQGSSEQINQEVTDVGTLSIHIGANQDQVIIINVPEISTYTLKTEHINVMTGYTAQLSIDIVDDAITKLNKVRSQLGAYENRFEHTENNLDVSSENLTKALSVMMDTDMAEEMTEYTSYTVMTQAATSILSQANQRPAEVLQILNQ